MLILGISAYFHDSAACLLRDGDIIAAAQEERFTRIKHDAAFPINAVRYCLSEAGIQPEQIDAVIFYEKPLLKFDRILETYLAYAPFGFRSFLKAGPAWIKEKLFTKSNIALSLSDGLSDQVLWKDRIYFSDHHLSHLASAFFPSPFDDALVVAVDGVGEWATTSYAIGHRNTLALQGTISFPHSIGLLYSAFTYYLGFKVNSGEYKVMGLAPYGIPKYVEKIRSNLIDTFDDGSFRLRTEFFQYPVGLKMVGEEFEHLFGEPIRNPESPISQFHMDIAASIQQVAQDVIIAMLSQLAKKTGQKNLCMAGGVALNCVINGILYSQKIFDNIWIQPAAGDAGGALGAAFAFWHMHCKNDRVSDNKNDKMHGSYLGPHFLDDEVKSALDDVGAVYEHVSHEDEFISTVSDEIESGAVVGWMQGRMEFGPRALGARSIIADPRRSDIQRNLNLKIKFRESFRPFAPSVLSEHVGDWFDLEASSPYMLLVADIQHSKRGSTGLATGPHLGFDKLQHVDSCIPAVTHVDYSARIQTVHFETNPTFYKLILKFFERTACPILVNTSFNVRGEPIVCTPSDAFRCFMGTDMDVLVINNFILRKSSQSIKNVESYHENFELD